MERHIAYNYDLDDYFYTYPQEAQMDPIENKPMLPAHSTLLAPPREWPEEKIPVFYKHFQEWEIVDNKFWKPIKKEINYSTGEDAVDIPQLPGIKMNHFCKYPNIPGLLAIQLFGLHFESRIKALNMRIKGIFTQHYNIVNSKIGSIELLAIYKTEIEFVIYLIKKSIDEIIALTYVKNHYEKIKRDHIIEINGIGQLIHKSKKLNKEIEDIRTELYYSKHKEKNLVKRKNGKSSLKTLPPMKLTILLIWIQVQLQITAV